MITKNNHHESALNIDGTSVPPRMKMYLSAGDDGKIWLYHDMRFAGPLEWAEYYADDRRLSLITEGGAVHEFHQEILPDMHAHVRKATRIGAVLMKDGKPADFAEVDLIVIGDQSS